MKVTKDQEGWVEGYDKVAGMRETRNAYEILMCKPLWNVRLQDKEMRGCN
jgi:hypothetical protein